MHHGAAIKACKNDGWRDEALHYTAGRGSLETAKVLLAFGAEPSTRNVLGHTPGDVARHARRPALGAYLDRVASGTVPVPSRREYAAKLAGMPVLSAKVAQGGKAAKGRELDEEEGCGSPVCDGCRSTSWVTRLGGGRQTACHMGRLR